MLRVGTREAKANLSQYLQMVGRGETVVICRRNQPVAELRALPKWLTKPRPIGLYRGTFKVPRSFFEPLADKVVAQFYGDT